MGRCRKPKGDYEMSKNKTLHVTVGFDLSGLKLDFDQVEEQDEPFAVDPLGDPQDMAHAIGFKDAVERVADVYRYLRTNDRLGEFDDAMDDYGHLVRLFIEQDDLVADDEGGSDEDDAEAHGAFLCYQMTSDLYEWLLNQDRLAEFADAMNDQSVFMRLVVEQKMSAVAGDSDSCEAAA